VPKKRTGDPPPHRGNGQGADPDLSHLSEAAKDQARAAADQSASDADQTASDADQTTSDVERELAARDQLASDRDQRASDRDQALSDRELDEHPDEGARASHDATLAERLASANERKEAGESRASAAEERVRQATRRDETAWHRDLTAQARDSASDRRDRDSAKIERKMASRGTPLRTAIAHAAEVRSQAARERAKAAEDRVQAAEDRKRAAEERAATLAELHRAHLDELTGAFRRGPGEEALQGEIERARRTDARLVLAFVDVDDLRRVNNRDGHSAGDALLRNVVGAIRAKIRSYEPIVRFGGDEFVCSVAGLDIAEAEGRFNDVQESLAQSSAGAAVTVGLAELREEDTLGDLVDRADAALLAARRGRDARADWSSN
jgi:diguanylate cyclase (GGDEF)-like protein